MSNAARGYLRSMQIHPALDVSALDLSEFNLTTRESVDELGARAIAEAEANGGVPGRLHGAWQKALMLRLDERLPSLGDANGAISQTVEQQAAKVAAAQASRAQYIDRSRMDPVLASLTLDGHPLVDWDVESAHNRLAELMIDLPAGPQRDEVSNVMAKLDGAIATSFTGIEWQMNDDGGGMTIEANTDSTYHEADLIHVGRQMLGMNPDHGSDALGALAIRAHRYGTDPLFAGITSMNPDGSGTVETFFDPVSQSIANAGMHQGDEGANTFSMEE